MRVAVNTRLLLKGKLEGIGRFSVETLKRITHNHPECEFVFLFDREFDESFLFSDNITPVIVPLQARHPVLFYIWFEWLLPPVIRKHKCDLFLSPDGYLSLNSEVKQLPVIHDLNFEYYPKHLPPAARAYYKFYFPKFAAKASRIATVSRFSRSDIAQQYNIDENKIDVVYNGVSNEFLPATEREKQHTKEQYAHGDSYFIYVGAIQPRKNIPMLLKAFDLFKESTGLSHRLVLAGEKKWWDSKQLSIYEGMKHKEDVIFTGRLDGKALGKILASAEALVYVSLFEGFGIPLLEAMRCEVPVITSGVTAMPEIAGNAAIKVSPFSDESIAEGLKKIATDDQLRAQLIAEGKRQSALFSWDRTAELLWDSVIKTIEQ